MDAMDGEARVWFGWLPWILPFSSSPDPRDIRGELLPFGSGRHHRRLFRVSPVPTATHRRPRASSSLSVSVAIVVVSSALSGARCHSPSARARNFVSRLVLLFKKNATTQQGCVFTRDINKAITINAVMEIGTVQIISAPARGP